MEMIKGRALQKDKMCEFSRSLCVLKANVDYFSVKLLKKYFGLTFDYKVSVCVALRRKEGPIIRDQKMILNRHGMPENGGVSKTSKKTKNTHTRPSLSDHHPPIQQNSQSLPNNFFYQKIIRCAVTHTKVI